MQDLTWADATGSDIDQKSPWFYEKLGNQEYSYSGTAGFYKADQTAYMSAQSTQLLRYWD